MKHRLFKNVLCAALAIGLMLWAGPALAKVSGVCSNCHTMHNSQDGVAMNTSPIDGSADDAVYGALTKGDCVGCHTGTNSEGGPIPRVSSVGEPVYGPDYDGTGALVANPTTLAGGTFYYVKAGDDATGHNVVGIAAEDSNLGMQPPGFDGGRAAADATTPNLGAATWSNQLTCAGTYGCHGTHAAGTNNWAAISGSHHSGASGAITAPGTAAKDGYRFLVGIKGYEDSDREFQPTTTAHNQYYGVDDPQTTTDTATISYLCAECHGKFHDGSGNVGTSSPWLRHPTDFDMYNVRAKADYANYNGDGSTYSVIAPVASTVVTAPISSGVLSASGKAIVTCISCHRAHGSKYDDLLRWDYANMVAETSGNFKDKGCFICHTTKDSD